MKIKLQPIKNLVVFRKILVYFNRLLEVKRRGKCNSAAREVIYRVSEAEYQAALSLLKAQVNAGQPFAFGLEALSVPKKKHHFWAINLKRFAPNNPEHTRVWSINADVGSDICPYKKL